MIEEEINQQIELLRGAFPQLRRWMADLHSHGNFTTMKHAWHKQLSRCHSDDVAQAVEAMVAGEIDLPEYYNFDRVAIVIKREASRLAGKRIEQTQTAKLVEARERSTLSPAVEKALREFRSQVKR